MTLIEGVGDEVIQFLGVTVVFIVAALAWWSTSYRPSRYRTVFIMRQRASSAVPTPNEIRAPPTVPETPPSEPEPRPRQRVSSADTSTENDQMREMNNIVNAMEAEISSDCDFFRDIRDSNNRRGGNTPAINDVPSGSTDEANNTEDQVIHIKLKYLNDSLKEVEGTLNELLKDFKLRHFSRELGAQQRVRLIFRGRVLSDDSATLRSCGLHDHAVLHCLVHGPRNSQVPEEPAVRAEAAQERPWDLENVLMTLVSVALTIVWLFRCEYSNMFTASASVALFGLTAFYSVAIFGLYLSDTFHFTQRPQQPVPTN